MRSLAKPIVLQHALLASLLSTLACVPRFAMWQERQYTVLFLSVTMLFCAFVLWAFVFAWHEQYSGCRVFDFRFQPVLWAIGTGYALGAAASLHFSLDDNLRIITPLVYPTDWPSWLAITLFSLSMEPLFLCFAPFAFFIRLSKRQTTAIGFTIMFGLLVVYLKLSSGKALPGIGMMAELIALRVVSAFVNVYFYLKGGVLLVWWVALVIQMRHLLEPWAGH